MSEEKYDHLTLYFVITDKEKFIDFHKKVFPMKKEQMTIANEIGGYAVISSWSNPFDENEHLNNALEFAMDNLGYDDSEICKLIAEGKTLDEANEFILKEN